MIGEPRAVAEYPALRTAVRVATRGRQENAGRGSTGLCEGLDQRTGMSRLVLPLTIRAGMRESRDRRR